MKSFVIAALLLGVAAASPALAQDSSVPPASPETAAPPAAPASDFAITGAVDVATQYRFRGISQSDNRPVIQGTFTITHKSGFYVSTWGSSASGNDAVNIGGTEIDVYGGYSHSLGKSGVVLDGGVYGYLYPGSRKAVGVSESYFEIYGDVSKAFGPISTKAGINWAPNQAYFKDFATPSRYDIYVFGELGFAIPKTPISLHSHLGHTGGGLDYATQDYLDFAAGVSYKWRMLTFDVSAVGTNLSRSDTRPYDLALGTDDFHRAAKTVVVGTVTASF
ncbi:MULTISPECIES: TorF family putative porin [unclassified Sphingomonas]|uniref:TorF family putative porin n=1 Tax=unclassified Sphingomonas TaxID=196159 RepID=UPI001F570900|nr:MULTISPECIES: TorF family putative porin [unclassified Sphingomonas]